MKKESQQVNPYPIRLTKELRAKLESSARTAGRSLNAEMLLRLEGSFDGNLAEGLGRDDVRKIVSEMVKEGCLRE